MHGREQEIAKADSLVKDDGHLTGRYRDLFKFHLYFRFLLFCLYDWADFFF